MFTDEARARWSDPLWFLPSFVSLITLSLSLALSLSPRHSRLCSHARAMATRLSPLFLLGLLCACSRIFFAAASPVRPSTDLWADESLDGIDPSSSSSLVETEAAVPLYRRCKQKKRFAMTFDDGPVRYPSSPHPYLPRWSS